MEPIRVRYPYTHERTEKMLSDLAIASPTGQLVPLTSVATIGVRPGTPELDRENERQMFAVTARLEGVDLGTGIRDVQNSLNTLPMPPGYSTELGGLYKSQQESFSALWDQGRTMPQEQVLAINEPASYMKLEASG